MYYKKKALVLIAILVVAATLSIPANISHATAQTQTQQTPQQMYVFDLLDKPIPMRLEAINDPTSKTAATVQRFAINQSNVVELTQGGDFVAKGTNDDQILKVTFTDLNGDNPVQLTQKSPPNSYYWSLAGISPGQYLCHVTTMVSQNNVEAIFGTKCVILASGQAPGFSSSITPPAFSSRVTPPGEQQQPIIPGVIQVPGQGQGQQQQPEPITPEITQGQGQQQPEQAALQGPVVDGFKADGTVNSVIFTPGTKWIATGNWSMFAGNGKMISFITDMAWYNNNGTGSHTHEFQKFVPIGVFISFCYYLLLIDLCFLFLIYKIDMDKISCKDKA